MLTKEFKEKRDCKWMGLVLDGLTLVSPAAGTAPACGAALCWYFCSQNTLHRLQESEPPPLHSSQLQSKSTFCTEQPARQPLFITFLLSSYWLPAGKSSLYLTSKFEAIFLVYFHTGTDSIFHAQVHTVPPVCKLTSHRNLSKAHLCSLGKAPGPGNPGDLMETFTLLP